MEQKLLIFGKQYINENAFHKIKISVSIDEVDTRTIALYKKDSYRRVFTLSQKRQWTK